MGSSLVVDEKPRWVSSYELLGERFGLHRASFPRLIKKLKALGISAPELRANGDHDCQAWEQFFAEHPEIRRQASEGTGSALDEGIKEEKLRALKFNNDEKAGLYVLRSEIDAWLTDKTQLVRDRLVAKLKQELPGKLEGLRATEIAARMDREINDLLKLLQGSASKGEKKK